MVTRSRLRGDQIPIKPVSACWIMSQPIFELGVADVRAGRGIHRDCDLWDTNGQWNYERGRAFTHPPNARGGRGIGSFAHSDFHFLPGKNGTGFSQTPTSLGCGRGAVPRIVVWRFLKNSPHGIHAKPRHLRIEEGSWPPERHYEGTKSFPVEAQYGNGLHRTEPKAEV